MSAHRSSTTHKHLSIAKLITADILDGTWSIGDALPSESALATRFRVARGTVRRALEHIEHTQHRLSRQGTRWVVHSETLAQDVTELRSFGQWAKAIGHEPGGRTVMSDEGRATVEEAHALSISPQLAYGEHLISAVLPDPEDARLLGISRITPLLRIQRAARTFDGRPFEYSDDRYLATATSLSIVNSARSAPRAAMG